MSKRPELPEDEHHENVADQTQGDSTPREGDGPAPKRGPEPGPAPDEADPSDIPEGYYTRL